MGKRGASKGEVRNKLGKNQYVERAGTGTRTEVITFRVSKEVKEKMRAQAKLTNESISDWLGWLIDRELENRDD